MIREEHHGKELTDNALSKLEVNKSTKEDVIELFGNPSTSSTFDDNTWYYMSLEKKGVSFLKPNITNQRSVRLRFKNNLLIEIKKFNGNENKSFKFNKKETQVNGNDRTVLKDFVRNLGRYNKDPQKRE